MRGDPTDPEVRPRTPRDEPKDAPKDTTPPKDNPLFPQDTSKGYPRTPPPQGHPHKDPQGHTPPKDNPRDTTPRQPPPKDRPLKDQSSPGHPCPPRTPKGTTLPKDPHHAQGTNSAKGKPFPRTTVPL
nr:acidic proline-rich protein PRP25-like [Penaeus vannamei]